MDIAIEKKKGLGKKHISYLIGGAAAVVVILAIALGNHGNRLKVDGDSLVIGTVTDGMFNDYVRINGKVQPITVIQLSPLESGIVQEKVVEEGAMVKKGDVILRLSNNQLNLDILNSEASLSEKENILRNTRLAMEQEKLNLKQEMINLKMEVSRKKRGLEQFSRLYKDNLVPEEDYLKAKEDYELYAERLAIVSERQRQDSISRQLQISSFEESLASMNKNMALTHERLENLNVKSPIDGQLGSLDIVLGQSVHYGDKIGQINDLSNYKVEAQIDEHYIDRVSPGLSAVMERQGTDYTLAVSKVYPEVTENTFKTDFIFEGGLPDNIRTGQTYNLNLQLGEPTNTVMIPRGSFFNKSGGKWIFVMSPDGKSAHRRQIRIGRQNPQYYEVLEGLEAGEKVITSSYDMFGDNEVLVLK